MKTEKEIRDKLEKALRDLEYIENVYDNTPIDSKYIFDICDDITFVEAEIKTLRWMLGE